MSTKIFVNVAVKDLEASKAFWGKLGYSFDPMFTDDNAACLVFSEEIYAMLLVEPFFQGFATKEITDTATHNEVLLCLSADSRAEVDEKVDAALASGGSPAKETMEDGPMYGRSFLDPDGHHWEYMFMDVAAMAAMGEAGGAPDA
ncbi:VOC family protein [Streptomyces sp. NPDC050504]|uniref:VOC family protein n=1 Tax=Streptomyces sp. NPDC050504 TaxID=3365618 RepID=UPI0037929694